MPNCLCQSLTAVSKCGIIKTCLWIRSAGVIRNRPSRQILGLGRPTLSHRVRTLAGRSGSSPHCKHIGLPFTNPKSLMFNHSRILRCIAEYTQPSYNAVFRNRLCSEITITLRTVFRSPNSANAASRHVFSASTSH